MGRASQAQETGVIPQTESLELVRCLLRVSVFHVSWMRGMFHDKCFNGVDMKNLDGMHIKMLKPIDDESRRMVDWVERGVYDAIRKGYAKCLFFGASEDPEGTRLIEEYVFSFSYGEDGDVVMDNVKVTSKGQTKLKNVGNVNSVRYQVCRLMRMLVQVCQTLDKLPEERYLFMKLTYYEHAPSDYEPPYFNAVPDNTAGYFARKPFTMQVGSVETGHHLVSLKVKSLLDAMVDHTGAAAGGGGGEADDLHEGQESAQVSDDDLRGDIDQDVLGAAARANGDDEEEGTVSPAAEGEVTSRSVAITSAAMSVDKSVPPKRRANPAGLDPRERAKADLLALGTEAMDTGRGDQDDDDDKTQCPAESQHADQYARLKQWCLRPNCTKVEVTDAMGMFMDIGEAVLELQFSKLVDEGVLRPSASNKDLYHVVRGKPGATAADEAISQQLVALSVRERTEASVQQQQRPEPRSPLLKKVLPDVATDRGAAQTAAGFAATESHAAPSSNKGGGRKRPEPPVTGALLPQGYVDASQESAALLSGRVRKASLTSLPIHQQPAAKRRCTRSSRPAGAR